MIRDHSPLRDVMDQSYLIYACARANHARYVPVKSKLQHPPPPGQPPGHLILGKKTSQVESVEHMKQYTRFVEKLHHLKRRGLREFI